MDETVLPPHFTGPLPASAPSRPPSAPAGPTAAAPAAAAEAACPAGRLPQTELPGGRIASSPARPSLQLLLSLPAVLSSVPYARTQLRRAVRLRCPDADPELLLQAALVVDELMANAVTHGSAHALGAEAPSVTLGLSLIPVRRLRIAVRDQGGGWPLPLGAPPRRSTAPDPPLEREDGRGLMLVQEFAERWGTFPAGGGTPHGCAPPAPESQDAALPDRGTVVWAVVPL